MSSGGAAGLTEFTRCGNNAPVIRSQRFSRLSAVVLLAVAIGLAPGCTLFGEPFVTDQPAAEVTVVGKIYIDSASGQEVGCSAGRVLLWGTARNTGDLDVDDVHITIDALDASNGVLGSYRVSVFNGEITEITTTSTTTTATTATEGTVQTAGTSLAVDESGTFSVCTGLEAGSVAGTTYRTDFIVVNEIK